MLWWGKEGNFLCWIHALFILSYRISSNKKYRTLTLQHLLTSLLPILWCFSSLFMELLFKLYGFILSWVVWIVYVSVLANTWRILCAETCCEIRNSLKGFQSLLIGLLDTRLLCSYANSAPRSNKEQREVCAFVIRGRKCVLVFEANNG